MSKHLSAHTKEVSKKNIYPRKMCNGHQALFLPWLGTASKNELQHLTHAPRIYLLWLLLFVFPDLFIQCECWLDQHLMKQTNIQAYSIHTVIK